MPVLPKPKLIVIKIDGTTTDRSFVQEVLLPYAENNMRSFLEEHWADDDVMELIAYLRKESDLDPKAPAIKNQTTDEARLLKDVLSYIDYLLKANVTSKGRQMLYLLVWGDGYDRLKLKSNLFPDVADAMYAWHKMQIPMAVYSGGNITANKMIFTFSEEGGNLDKFVTKYLDVKVIGNKDNEESFERIARDFNIRTRDILFLTDSKEEGRAARNANCQVVIMTRPGNPEISADQMLDINCKSASSFLDVTFDR